MMRTDTHGTRYVLVVYRDSALLQVLGRPKVLGRAADACVEVALDSRLGACDLTLDPFVLDAPSTGSIREAWSSAMARVDRIGTASPSAVIGLVCHLDDLEAFLPHMRSIDDVRLLWHPADVAGARLEDTLRRLEGSAVGHAIGPYPAYFAAYGREASAADWMRVVNCPVLQMFADTARRRRRSLDHTGFGETLVSPSAPNSPLGLLRVVRVG